MPKLSTQIKETEAQIGAVKQEIEQLQQRLAQLRTYPQAPGPDATSAQKINHQVQLARLQSERAPEISGTEAAIVDLTSDLEQAQQRLAELQAQATQEVREQRVAEARARIEELTGELTSAADKVWALVEEISSVAASVEADFQALQQNPHPKPESYNISSKYYDWRPWAFMSAQYDPGLLPVCYSAPHDNFSLTTRGVQQQIEENEATRRRQLEAMLNPQTIGISTQQEPA